MLTSRFLQMSGHISDQSLSFVRHAVQMGWQFLTFMDLQAISLTQSIDTQHTCTPRLFPTLVCKLSKFASCTQACFVQSNH